MIKVSDLDIFELESMEAGDSFISEFGDFSVIHYGENISLVINSEELSHIRHFFSLESLIAHLEEQG